MAKGPKKKKESLLGILGAGLLGYAAALIVALLVFALMRSCVVGMIGDGY